MAPLSSAPASFKLPNASLVTFLLPVLLLLNIPGQSLVAANLIANPDFALQAGSLAPGWTAPNGLVRIMKAAGMPCGTIYAAEMRSGSAGSGAVTSLVYKVPTTTLRTGPAPTAPPGSQYTTSFYVKYGVLSASSPQPFTPICPSMPLSVKTDSGSARALKVGGPNWTRLVVPPTTATSNPSPSIEFSFPAPPSTAGCTYQVYITHVVALEGTTNTDAC